MRGGSHAEIRANVRRRVSSSLDGTAETRCAPSTHLGKEIDDTPDHDDPAVDIFLAAFSPRQPASAQPQHDEHDECVRDEA